MDILDETKAMKTEFKYNLPVYDDEANPSSIYCSECILFPLEFHERYSIEV